MISREVDNILISCVDKCNENNSEDCSLVPLTIIIEKKPSIIIISRKIKALESHSI